MKLYHWKLVAAAIAVGVPVVWALSVLDSDRSGDSESAEHSADVVSRQPKSQGPQARHRGAERSWQPRARAPRFEAGEEVEEFEDAEVSYEEHIAASLAVATKEEASFVTAFEGQSVDTSWAPRWEAELNARITADLGELEGFAHSEVECRTDKCLASVTWDDYGSARQQLGNTIDLTKGECATFTFMPPPQSPDGRYTHKIRFDGCPASES